MGRHERCSLSQGVFKLEYSFELPVGNGAATGLVLTTSKRSNLESQT